MPTFRSSKTFGHDLGLSCAFRQWKANSHCRFVHGYALSIHIEFEAAYLDERNWVVDFGDMKDFKRQLEAVFDHKTIVAADDPEIEFFREAERRGLIQLVVAASTGAESFAELIACRAQVWLREKGYGERCYVASVEVKEHGANGASYRPDRL
jgi:6-pyruvoyltetrahydropterin/6-carboxytetrahydropterin synthase